MKRPDALRIEPVTKEDVASLLELIKALADYEHLRDQVSATEEGLREALFSEARAAEAAFATVGGRKAGYAIWFPTFSTFLGARGMYLEDLFVLPDWRGQGVGQALLAHVAAIAVERGCGRLEWAVLDWNDRAIGFYRRMGARPMRGWTVFRLAGEELRRLGAGSEKANGR